MSTAATSPPGSAPGKRTLRASHQRADGQHRAEGDWNHRQIGAQDRRRRGEQSDREHEPGSSPPGELRSGGRACSEESHERHDCSPMARRRVHPSVMWFTLTSRLRSTAARVRKPASGSRAAASTGITVPTGVMEAVSAHAGVRSEPATASSAAPNAPDAIPSSSASRSGRPAEPARRGGWPPSASPARLEEMTSATMSAADRYQQLDGQRDLRAQLRQHGRPRIDCRRQRQNRA